MLSKTLCGLLQYGATGVIAMLLLCGQTNGADTATSVWQGVYTKAQAARGQAAYFSTCASCHGAQLQGDSDSPELSGNGFLKRWTSVGALFAFAESQMPVGRPRSLGAQGYADVIAHILARNGFPEGQQELPGVPAVLDKIIIEGKK